MFSVERWPEPAVRAWVVAQRFQKFLIVGAVGLGVNQGLLFVFHDLVHLRLLVSSALAIFISMLVTFSLNERWTWHDRGKGPVLNRMAMYFPINCIGLLINVGILTLLVDQFHLHYLVANLFGAGTAAIWNFAVNHKITWRESAS
jgi:putative flippase GtrA